MEEQLKGLQELTSDYKELLLRSLSSQLPDIFTKQLIQNIHDGNVGLLHIPAERELDMAIVLGNTSEIFGIGSESIIGNDTYPFKILNEEDSKDLISRIIEVSNGNFESEVVYNTAKGTHIIHFSIIQTYDAIDHKKSVTVIGQAIYQFPLHPNEIMLVDNWVERVNSDSDFQLNEIVRLRQEIEALPVLIDFQTLSEGKNRSKLCISSVNPENYATDLQIEVTYSPKENGGLFTLKFLEWPAYMTTQSRSTLKFRLNEDNIMELISYVYLSPTLLAVHIYSNRDGVTQIIDLETARKAVSLDKTESQVSIDRAAKLSYVNSVYNKLYDLQHIANSITLIQFLLIQGIKAVKLDFLRERYPDNIEVQEIAQNPIRHKLGNPDIYKFGQSELLLSIMSFISLMEMSINDYSDVTIRHLRKLHVKLNEELKDFIDLSPEPMRMNSRQKDCMLFKEAVLELKSEYNVMLQQSEQYKTNFNPDLVKKQIETIKKWINKFGWPMRSEFGNEAAEALLFYVLNASNDLEFQKNCLLIMLELPDTELPDLAIVNLQRAITENEKDLVAEI